MVLKFGVGRGYGHSKRALFGSSALSPPPVNAVLPAITGGGTEGSLLTGDLGTFTGTGLTFTRQWTRDNAPILGEINAVYQTGENDDGTTIREVVTATDSQGRTATATSNGIAIKNGIIVAVAFRSTITIATSPVNTRWVAYLGADNGTSVVRTPATGPAPSSGDYAIATSGSLGYGDEGSASPNLLGYLSIGGSGGRVRFPHVPIGVPLAIRSALGVGFITNNSGMAVYDGNPDSGGTLLFTQSVTSQPGGTMLDASGVVMTSTLWDATNTARTTKTNSSGVDTGVAITCTTGEIWIRQNASANPVYLRAFMIHHASYGIEMAGVGPLFVKPTGDNTKDGKTLATAWKNWPGDPQAVGGVVSQYVPLPGCVINAEGGVVHKVAGFAGGRTNWLRQPGAGSSGSPIIVQPRAGTGEIIVDGSEDLPFITAATTGDTGSNPNTANITYELQGSAVEWIMAPVCGGVPLRPATFPKATDITAYDFSDSGSDAYFAEGQVTGPGGSAPLFVEGAADSSRAGFKLCTYTGPRILARYGAVSISGYMLSCRFVGNQIENVKIVGHVTATGVFTFEIANAAAIWVSQPDYDFLWQVRYHPFDILEEGQYGYDTARLKPMGWFPATGTRGIVRLSNFATLTASDWTFNNILFRNFMGSSAYVALDAGALLDRIKFNSCRSRGTASYARNYLWAQTGGGTGWSWIDIDVADNFTNGGITPAISHTTTLLRCKFRESGRTLVYTARSSPNQSTDITVTDCDLSDNSGIHANGGTTYEDAQRVKFLHLMAANHIRPITTQGATNNFSRANEIGYATLIGRLKPAGAPNSVSLFVVGNDNNCTDCWWHHMLVGEGTGVHLGPNSAGHVIENFDFSALYANAGGLTGIIFRNGVIRGGSFSSLADLIANGADASSYGVVFTGTAYDGTITDAGRKAITAIAATGTYQDVNIGTTTDLPWVIPAWGTSFALADPKLTTSNVRKGHQANKPFGQFVSTQPESVLSLPAGVSGGNNAMFTLVRGKPAFASDAVSGSWNLDLMQTNASANRTGPSTKTTRFVIVVP